MRAAYTEHPGSEVGESRSGGSRSEITVADNDCVFLGGSATVEMGRTEELAEHMSPGIRGRGVPGLALAPSLSGRPIRQTGYGIRFLEVECGRSPHDNPSRWIRKHCAVNGSIGEWRIRAKQLPTNRPCDSRGKG